MNGRCSYLRLQIQQDSRALIYIVKAISWQTRRAADIIFLKESFDFEEHMTDCKRPQIRKPLELGSHWL